VGIGLTIVGFVVALVAYWSASTRRARTTAAPAVIAIIGITWHRRHRDLGAQLHHVTCATDRPAGVRAASKPTPRPKPSSKELTLTCVINHISCCSVTQVEVGLADGDFDTVAVSPAAL
jgi:hypothetical protein